MLKTNLNKVMDKFLAKRTANFILGKRLCQKCASVEWKDLKETEVTQLLGICSSCGKGGLVAYIEYK